MKIWRKRSRSRTISGIRPSDIPARRCWPNACASTAASITIARACAWWSCSKTRIRTFRGLNLTFEVREGLQKHQAFYDPPRPGEEKYRCPSLEAQIANLADEITYYSHDLDDAVDFEILSAAQLEKNAVWQRSHRTVLARYPDAREPELHKLIIRDIIDVQVQDVVTTQRTIDCRCWRAERG